MLSTAYTHQKVVRLDIPVQVETRVDVLDTLNHLVSQHQDRLEGELPVALAEQLLQTSAEGIHDHHVAFLVTTEPVNLRDTNTIVEYLVDLLLV